MLKQTKDNRVDYLESVIGISRMVSRVQLSLSDHNFSALVSGKEQLKQRFAQICLAD